MEVGPQSLRADGEAQGSADSRNAGRLRGRDDELAILEVLDRSYNFELSYIFGAGGVTVSRLESDFDGEELDFLKDFFEHRFEGGFQAARSGKLKPIGSALQFGAARILPGHTMSEALPNADGKWNAACVLGILCSEDKAVVAQLPKLSIRVADEITEYYWRYQDGAWKEKHRTRGAAHKAGTTRVFVKENRDCGEVASNLMHEVRHHNQPENFTPAQIENDAYKFTEDWAIKRGIPSRSEFRTTNPDTGQEITDVPAIEAYVKQNYSKEVAVGQTTVGPQPDGKMKIEHKDGSVTLLEPSEGDEYQNTKKIDAELDKLQPMPTNIWVCPTEPKEAEPKPAESKKAEPKKAGP